QISLPSTVYVDQTLTGSFTLDSPAPPTGTVITLSGLGITNLQSDVVLPGDTTGRFTGTAADVPMVQVTGSLRDSTFTSSSLVMRAGVSAID
ncbi:hypothetical protein ABTN55_19820, partial [Acinetobacter baumannii]